MCVHKSINKVVWKVIVNNQSYAVHTRRPTEACPERPWNSQWNSLTGTVSALLCTETMKQTSLSAGPKVDPDQTTWLRRNLMHRIWPRKGRGLSNTRQNTHLKAHIHDKTYPKYVKHVEQEFIERDGWFWGAGLGKSREPNKLTNGFSFRSPLFYPKHGYVNNGGLPLPCWAFWGFKSKKT